MNNNMNNMNNMGMGIGGMGGGMGMGGMGMNNMGSMGMGGGMNGMNGMGGMSGMPPNMGGSGGRSINPSQLIGGMGGMGMGGAGSGGGSGGINPAQLLQQQHQRERDHQMVALQPQQRGGYGVGNMGGMSSMNGMGMNNMGNMSNMGGMSPTGINMGSMGGMNNMSDPIQRPGTSMSLGGGVTATSMSMGPHNQGVQPTGNVYPPSNPHPSQGGQGHSHPHSQGHGQLLHPSQHSSHPQQHPSQQGGLHGPQQGMGMQGHGSQSHHPGGPQGQNQGQPQGHAQRPDPAQLLAMLGISKEQYNALSPQEKAPIYQRMMAIMQQQQQRRAQGVQGQHMGQGMAPQQGGMGQQGMGGGQIAQGGIGQVAMGTQGGMGMGMGGMSPEDQRPRSSASLSSSGGGQGPPQMPGMGMQGLQGMQGMGGMHGDTQGMGMGGMMPPPPPRPSTAMSSHSASGRNASGSGNMQGMSGSGMGSRPGTAMGMRAQGGQAGQGGQGSVTTGNPMVMSGSSTGAGKGVGMGMGMINGQMSRHPSGPVPGSPIIRPASRAMSVSSATGNEGSGNNMVGSSGGASGMINGTPVTPVTPMTPKHPGTPQMGGQALGMHGGQQGSQGLQNQHQGTPPPASPAMNGPSLKRKASNMGIGIGMPESPRIPSMTGTHAGPMGMGIGNMGPPFGVPSHQQNGIMPGQQQQTPQKPGMGMGRPGTGVTGTPTVSAAALPISSVQTPQTPMSGQAPSTRQASLPPGTPSQPNPIPQGHAQNQSGQDQNDSQTVTGDAAMVDGTGKGPTPVVNGIPDSSGTAATPSQAQLNGPVIPQLPPLPANVNLNAAVTKVTVVPLVGSDKAIPMLAPEEIEDIKKWQAIDKEYDGIWKGMKDRMQNELRGEVFGKTKWWEKGSAAVNPGVRFRRRIPPEGFDVRYPGKGRRDHHHSSRGKKVVKREGLKIPRRLKKEDANRPERLVPIRLEFDVDHYRMRDTFVWNLNDPVVTPEHFAQSLCEDYNLGQNYHSLVVRSIQDQLNDYKAHSPHYDAEGSEFSDAEEEPEKGNLDEKSAAWWESWRKRLRTEAGFLKYGKRSSSSAKRKVIREEDEDDADVEMTDLDDERPMALEDFKMDEKEMTEDMRILIKLDIIVGSMKLDDQFEWDLDNLTASPEQFAEVYAQDLGLGGEFKTAIAHAIREQVQTYQKSLYIVGRPSDNTPIQDEDLRSAFLPNLSEGARAIDQIQSFTPHLNYLSDGEIERNEKERDKDMNKRRKRNTRGRRGANLPDREPIRTHRTPAIGFPELDPATLALAAAANAPVSRRAAAAAASLTIANMVASENGMPLLPTNVPAAVPQPAPSAAKEKKTKGLFKAPPVPPSILNSRARMTKLGPTTAADVSALPAPLENDPPPSISTPDSKATRVLSAKRAKELEREAKEKEFVDGQHSNWIDGVWHCSNCGCPDSIAVGRRKGPLGDKSQCGVCGKYWHRHRRPRPVEYNTDPEFHMNVLKKETEPKSGAKKKSGAAALRGQNTVPSTPADLISEPPTPARRKDLDDLETPTRPSSPPGSRRHDDDRAASPVSTVSSASEPPLSQRVKANGTASAPRERSPTPAEAVDVKEEPSSEPPPASTATQSPPIAPASPARSWPPQWLSSAMHSTQAKYPNDKFELALRKVSGNASPEWRIKCIDCPGKLYKPGPGETLSNFEVHLKNRQHRQRVDDRVNGDS